MRGNEPTRHTGKPPGSSTAVTCFMDAVAKEAEEYATDRTTPLSDLLEEIEHFTLTRTPYPSMLTGRVEGRFLQLVTRLSGARRVVEIGTFTGYSALAMAECCLRAQASTNHENPSGRHPRMFPAGIQAF